MLTEISGNLLEATEQYIVQQCCCTAVKAHGLSDVIARVLGVNVYAIRRREGRKNLAVPADRAVPGTIRVEKNVINLFGPFAMGKPGAYHTDLGVPDSAADRVRYFREGLDAIRQLAPASVAFPYRIGCGLAGGNWTVYRGMLEEFAAANPAIRVVVYRL
jgi:hypothetical protein